MGKVVSLQQRRIAHDAEKRLLHCRDTLFAIHQRAQWFMMEKSGAITLTFFCVEISNYEEAVEQLLEVARPSGVNERLRWLIHSAWELYFEAGALIANDSVRARVTFGTQFAAFSGQVFDLFPRLGKGPSAA